MVGVVPSKRECFFRILGGRWRATGIKRFFDFKGDKLWAIHKPELLSIVRQDSKAAD